MRRSWMLLGLGGAVVVLTIALRSDRESPVPPEPENLDQAEAAGAAPPPEDHQDVDPPDPGIQAPEAEAQRRVATDPREEAGQPAQLRGRVAWPAEGPARGEAFAVLRGVRKHEGQGFFQNWEEYENPTEFDRVTLDGSTGEFTLSVPPGLERAHVELEAELLVGFAPVPDPDDPEPVVLEAKVGGALEIQLKPEPGLVADPQQLVGQDFVLQNFPLRGGFAGSPPSTSGSIQEDLSVRFFGLALDRSYSAYVVAPPFARLDCSVSRLLPGTITRVEIPIRDGLTLRGTVLDESGEPIAGSSIRVAWGGVHPDGGRWTGYQNALADSSGAYRLEGVDPRLTEVRVQAEGYLSKTLAREALGSGLELRIPVVLERGRAISGTVLLGEAPVENAEVSLRVEGESFPERGRKATTDTAGRFAFTGLEAGRFRVQARAAFETPPEPAAERIVGVERIWRQAVWSSPTVDASPGEEALVFQLEAPIALRGRVLDHAGDPVRVFTIEALPQERFGTLPFGGHFLGAEGRAYDSEDGTFALEGLALGSWAVRADAAEYDPSEVVHVDLATPPEDLVLRLVGTTTVSGIVLGPDGQPVVGARVKPVRTGAGGRLVNLNLVGSSGGGGRFELAGLSRSTYELVASKGDLICEQPTTVDLSSGQGIKGIEVRLQHGGRLVLEVRLPDDRPALGQEVYLRGPTGTRDVDSPVTDGAGHAEVSGLVPGPWGATVYLQDEQGRSLGSDSVEFEVRRGETTQVTLGGALDVAVVVNGRVTSGGRAIPAAAITAEEALEGRRRPKSARSDESGAFRMELERGGSVAFQVKAPGGRLHRFLESVPASGEHRLAFDLPVAGLRGRLLVDGELPPMTLVVVRRRLEATAWAGGESHQVRPEEDGSWSCLHLDPGRYEIIAGPDDAFSWGDGAGGAGPERGTLVLRGLVLEPGEVREGIELRLPTAGVVEGRLIAPEGTGLSRARVYARLDDGTPLTLEGSSNLEGDRYAVRYLPPTDLWIEAVAEGLASGPVRTRVEPGESTALDLRLVPATLLHLDLEAPATGDLRLSVRDSAGLEHGWHRGMQANWFHLPGASRRSLGPLVPGTYEISLRSSAGEALTTVELKGEPERELRLDLP